MPPESSESSTRGFAPRTRVLLGYLLGTAVIVLLLSGFIFFALRSFYATAYRLGENPVLVERIQAFVWERGRLVAGTLILVQTVFGLYLVREMRRMSAAVERIVRSLDEMDREGTRRPIERRGPQPFPALIDRLNRILADGSGGGADPDR